MVSIEDVLYSCGGNQKRLDAIVIPSHFYRIFFYLSTRGVYECTIKVVYPKQIRCGIAFEFISNMELENICGISFGNKETIKYLKDNSYKKKFLKLEAKIKSLYFKIKVIRENFCVPKLIATFLARNSTLKYSNGCN